jgi:hypothetical protein
MCIRRWVDNDRLVGGVCIFELAGSIEHRVGDRADVRVNAFEIAQYIEV